MKSLTASIGKLASIIILLLFPNYIFAYFDVITEAEDAIHSGNYDIISHANASNGNYIECLTTSPSGSIELAIDSVDSAGTYRIEVFHFNGGLTENVDISINGSPDTTITLQESNWAEQGVALSTVFEVELIAGSNTISFTASYDTLLIDKFRVTDKYRIYYVSSNGDDNNDGSFLAPWKSIDKVSAASEKTSKGGILFPGDKVLFNRGDTFLGHLELKQSGTLNDSIEYSSYGTGDLPILSGSGSIPGGDYFQAIEVTNASYLVFSNLWLKNDRQDSTRYAYGSGTSYGIRVNANKWGGISGNMEFRNLTFTDIFGVTMNVTTAGITAPSDNILVSGIYFYSEKDDTLTSTDVRIENIIIKDCYFKHIGRAGIKTKHKANVKNNPVDSLERNRNFIIRDNTFEQLGGAGVILASVYNTLIENNDFIDLGWGDRYTYADRYRAKGEGIWTWNARNVIFQYNRQYGARGNLDTYASHIDFFCKNVIFQYNYSEDTEGGFCEILGDCYNSTYRFNVSVNDGFRDFLGHTLWISGFVGDGNAPVRSDKNYIYNNTIYYDADTTYKPDISLFAKDTYVYNNIFSSSNGAKIGSEEVTIDIDSLSQLYVANNLFKGDISTDFTDLDSNKIIDQWPSFQDSTLAQKEGFILNDGSPAIDNGKSFPQPPFLMAGKGIFKSITEYPTIDAFGVPVDINNNIPNIGASNEYNTGQSMGIGAKKIEHRMFSVYPNPVKGDINVTLTEARTKIQVNVYDVMGKLVFTTATRGVKQNIKVSLPNTIKNGIYLINLSDGNINQTSQIILYR